MYMNMRGWLNNIKNTRIKGALPVLSFPAVQLMGITVRQLISNSEFQARGMELISRRCDTLAAVSLMDLSVEAECFGSSIRFSDNEVPTVYGRILESEEDARALAVPEIGAGRTGIYIEAVKKAAGRVVGMPVLAGTIGPFSLAGRLMDMTEIMANCYDEPDMVHITLEKATSFIIEYMLAFKRAGANGVIMAEPAAGLLSPALVSEFSSSYVKRIVNAVEDDGFIVIYHNCGKVQPLIAQLLEAGASAYHFGNAVDMAEIMKKMPENILALGNVDPAGQIRNGTPESVEQATRELLERCSGYSNFVLSTGCDVPPMSPWENIDAFFETAARFYGSLAVAM